MAQILLDIFYLLVSFFIYTLLLNKYNNKAVILFIFSAEKIEIQKNLAISLVVPSMFWI